MINEKVIIAGFGGQGVMLLGQLLAYAANEEKLNTLWFPSYGPETRGGTANCSVTISSEHVNSPVISNPDSIIIMNEPSLNKFLTKVQSDGKVFINSSLVLKEVNHNNVYSIPANDIALEIGNIKVANMVMLGAYLEVNKIFSHEVIFSLLSKFFGESKAHLIDINVQAIKRGAEVVR